MNYHDWLLEHYPCQKHFSFSDVVEILRLFEASTIASNNSKGIEKP